MAIDRAQALLEGQLRDNDAVDTKAQGVIALVVGIVGVLIAVHQDINSLWWLPAASLSGAGCFLLVAIWPREYDAGPEPASFYEDYGLAPILEARRQMLAELLSSVAANDPVVEQKTRMVNWAFVLFGISLLGTVLVTLIR